MLDGYVVFTVWARRASGAALCLVAWLAQATAAADLGSKLLPVIESHPGRVAVAVKHLSKGESFAYRGDEPMPTASLIKFPVMVEAYRQSQAGRLDLDKMLTLRKEDKVPGSGILTSHFSAGVQLSLRDAIRLMIVYSDNTATNLVLDQIGIASVAKAMEELGLPHTKIHAKVYRRDTSVFPERSKRFGLGSTTAAETLRLYELLHQGRLGSEAATEQMTDHLLRCDDRRMLVRSLPRTTQVAHKSGAVDDVRCDAGILRTPSGPIAVCVLTAENKDRRWTDDNAAERLCGEIALRVFDHFNPHARDEVDRSPPVLRLGATGRRVEELQRTLNARLRPSPELSVDGDFGSLTRDAVICFQKEQGLAASGEVGPETWSALGTLLTQDPPVPDPQVVNSEVLPRQPAEDASAPPQVTCKAWAIADGKTGQLLWGKDADKPLDFASTTKVMTAYVVLRLAAREPAVLEERVVFSERADATQGSTADVRAGEELTVGELLYGLLLPSGNDASVALAEHFGARFERSGDGSAQDDPVPRFVAEMNRTAQSLDMRNTQFRNTHGLTDREHRSTASDLTKLAHAALSIERLRTYVTTRQHGCRLKGPGGSYRNVVWKNTNRLLEIEGYEGVKTGTTEAAGACLVAAGRKGTDQLLVVVLGATSSDARYVDSRNLFRWAWRQREVGP